MVGTETKKTTPQLADLVAKRFEESTRVPEAFFATEAKKISQACWAMATRFHQGGRILAFGNGPCATDAHHVAVEFVHPVIVGKRALPAMAFTNDCATLTAYQRHALNKEADFQRQVKMLARNEDMALGFSQDGNCENVLAALTDARNLGMLTLGFVGAKGGALVEADLDYRFVVPDTDPFVVQETIETLYHILWELVHVFFEHEGLLK